MLVSMSHASSTSIGVSWAVLATALWGATFLGPAAVAPVGPIYLVFGRYFVFGAISAVVVVVMRKRVRTLGARRVLIAVHLGIVGYVGFYLFFSFAAELGGGALASIITGVMPAAVTIASNLVKRQIAWRALATPIGLTCAGLVALNLRLPLTESSTGQFIATTGFALLACALWSYFVVVNGLVLKAATGPRIDNTTWTALIGTGALIGSFALLPIAWVSGSTSPTVDHMTFVRFAVVSVLLAAAGSWCASWSWNRATARISTVILGQLMALETLFGGLFNLLWDQRWPTLHELIGAALVTVGVITCVRALEAKSAASMKPPMSEESKT